MKKLFSLLTAGLLCLSLMTGCTPENKKPAPETSTTEDKTELPEKQKEKETSPDKPKAETPKAEEGFSYADLEGLDFVYSSGVGSWCTSFKINADGTFHGTYYDWNAVGGDDHPNGTIDTNDFTGTLSQPEKVDDFTFSAKIESIQYSHTLGTEEIKDQMKIYYSEAVGFEADLLGEVQFYLPGTPLSQLSEDFLYWSKIELLETKPTELSHFGIYNTAGKIGAIGFDPLPSAKTQMESILAYAETTDAEIINKLQTDTSLSQADMNGLAYQRFTCWDQCMKDIWTVLEGVLSPEELAELSEEQEKWVLEKDAAVEEACKDCEGGSIYPLVFNDTNAQWMQERVKVLIEKL